MLDSLKKVKAIKVGQIYKVDNNYLLIARVEVNRVQAIYIGDGKKTNDDVGNRYRSIFCVYDCRNINKDESEEVLGKSLKDVKLVKKPLTIYGVW